MAPLVSFWHGPLGWIERLCISSMIETGHELTLYSYDPRALASELSKSGFPSIPVEDAATALKMSPGISDQLAARPALAANLVRYKLNEASKGTWVDLDMLMLRPIPDAEYLMGYAGTDRKWINNAVLKLPPNSALLRDMIEFCEQRPVLAPWWRGKRKWKHQAMAMIGRPIPPERCQWGVFGPKALTHFIRQRGLENKVAPAEAYHPVPYREAALMVTPGADIARYITPETIGVHLWANALRKVALHGPAPGSWLAGRMDGLRHPSNISC